MSTTNESKQDRLRREHMEEAETARHWTGVRNENAALRAQVSQLTADLEVARNALDDGVDQLHWINAQAVNIMESTSHLYVTNEDSAVARMMIDSMASDIGVNAMMLHDKLTATLNTIRKDG